MRPDTINLATVPRRKRTLDLTKIVGKKENKIDIFNSTISSSISACKINLGCLNFSHLYNVGWELIVSVFREYLWTKV